MNQTQEPYKHTQIGTLILVLLTVIALFIVVQFTIIIGWNWIFIAILGFILTLGFIFSRLTVEVKDGWLRCWFGLGLIRREFPLNEIVEAVAVKNHWYYGWGIRITPHGWMFNVSGLDAVEITLTSGKRFRIGTDQPEQLEAAIRRSAGLS